MGTTSAPRRLIIVLSMLLLGLAACSDDHDGGGSATTEPADAESPRTEVAEPPEGVDRLLVVDDDEAVATLDPRFLSYNIEMVEVTGGEFWQPYDSGSGKVTRPPIDLGSERLRNLARGLGPAYIRVSGTWTNQTHFDPEGDDDTPVPEGFNGLLSGERWKGVGEFAEAVDGLVMTSFAVSGGTRDADGRWSPDDARSLLEFSAENDVPLVAAEFLNEPGYPIGLPPGYDVDAYSEDFATFVEMAAETAPDLRIVGPSVASDARSIVIPPTMDAEEILERTASDIDVFSYHVYPKVSERCGNTDGPETAFDPDFLAVIEIDRDFYDDLRDEFLPGAPTWVTEVAQAACGGDRWASTWRDVVRFTDTLGRLGNSDGNVVFHNTLAASDYALLDEDGFVPRPNYWAAVLWSRLMGPEVLAVGDGSAEDSDATAENLRTYAHCSVDGGAVAWAVINASEERPATVATPSGSGTLRLLTGESVDGTVALLGGTVLEVDDDGTLPSLDGVEFDGPVELPPASVAFITEPVTGGPCA